jgi:NAD-dependent SIR2 family protein deacetylase
MTDIDEELIEYFKKGYCGIFVGAGLSQGAGLPSWDKLLTELIDKVVETKTAPDSKIREFRKLIKQPSKYLMLAEELKETLPSELPAYIKERFDDKSINPTDAHLNLVKLNYAFIITTNYDILIERAYTKVYNDFPTHLTYKDAAAINYNLWNNEKFILKAHGDARSAPKEIILTEKDYRNILYKETGYQSVLQVMFSLYNIVFFGASLNDPEINLLLGFIHNIFHGGSPKHYALMNKKELTNTEADRWRKDFNINIIPYDPHNNHIEVTNFIKGLVEKTA